MNKHHLVSLISARNDENYPQLQKPLYSGKLSSVPTSTTAINKLPAGKLRAILKHHNCPVFGTKDQLVLRVLLLRQGHTKEIALPEEQQLKDVIKVSQRLIIAQRRLNLSSHVFHRRIYTTQASSSFLPVPEQTKISLPCSCRY